MCRIEEKVYIGADGRSRTFQDTFECDRARRRGKRCSKPDKKRREYIGAPPITRDDVPSPASNNPPTPPESGGYVIEERRPSASGRRPSLKPGSSVKPEIIIQIGGSRNDKYKKYPRPEVSKSYKRSSLGSTASGDIAVESPGSDASYTAVRTGFAETPVPPYGQSYTTRHVVPQGHRHTPSASSVTTSQTPSLYTTSETEPESPLGRHAPEYPRTIVHNSRPTPPSPVTPRTQSGHSTKLGVSHNSSRDTSLSRERKNEDDYSDLVDMYASSHVSTSSSRRAPEVTDKSIDRERQRKRKEDEQRRENEKPQRDEDDARSKESEQAKQVRFAGLETGRYEERERIRQENKLAESEKRRAEEREKERQRKKEQERRAAKEPEKRATKRPEREKTQPPTREFPKATSGGRSSRRNSMTMTPEQVNEQKRLLEEEQRQMFVEREATERRELEERAVELRMQQYSTRPQPYLVEEVRPSGQRRASISKPPPITGLGRTNSTRRASIIHQNPPPLTPSATAFPAQQSYPSTRPPSSHAQQAYSTREALPSARYSPSKATHPFDAIVQPPVPRGSNSSMENNPFAAPSTRPVHPNITAWDTQHMQQTLPTYPPTQGAQYAPQGHARVQQASRNLNQAYGNGVQDEWR